MKKMICFVSVIVLVFTVAGVPSVFARSKRSKDAAVAQKKNAVPKKIKEMLASKRASLENTSWNIGITASTGEKKASDVVIFKDKKFSMQGLSAKGFAPVDYSLSFKDDDSGLVVLETMQTSENEGTVFWKLEFAADEMSFKGIFSEVSLDQKSQDLYCAGSKIITGGTT